MKFDIKSWLAGSVLFTAELTCAEDTPPSVKLGLAVRLAVASRAYLSGANLSGANLSGADLSGANLSRANLSGADLSGAYLVDGGQRSDGYRFVGWVSEGTLQVRAGCRSFSMSAAREHWLATRGCTPLGAETTAILNHIERVARIRGLIA